MRRRLLLACTLILFAFVAEPASAQVQTATAHGAGTIPGVSFDTVLASFNAGGQGVSFHFDFRGSGMGPGIPVSGSFTVIDRETGVSLDFSGAGVVFPASHELQVTGMCDVTTPGGGTLPGACSLFALDRTSNGATDVIVITGSAVNGTLTAGLEPSNGNININ